ncbi:hypothetical protein [Bacillus phage SPO1L1]|nr:hypothetical protein [Bacillus phage SPO1L1]WIT26196.1 hypothetical protein [Bacillus phage SPO1L2]
MSTFKHWEHTEYVNKEDYQAFLDHNVPLTPSVSLPYNTAVYVESPSEGSKRLEGIYDPTVKGIRKLKSKKEPNRDLRLYQDAMMSDHMTVVAVNGLMGTGKTSTCIEYLISQHLAPTISVDGLGAMSEHHKLLIAKPSVNADGEEYGFLPGDINEKIQPTLANYVQYFERNHQCSFDELREAGVVEILPLGFIRGLDAKNMTIVVDECQNTKELVTVVTRKAKEDSRIFLLGDTSPFQIDRQGNTPENNGLTHIIDLLCGASYFQYIEMTSIENIVRSDEVKDIVKRLFKKHGSDPKEWV